MSDATIETVKPYNPLEVLWNWPEMPIDETTMGMMIGATTDTYEKSRGLGRTVQDLTNLHCLIRGYCSDRFRELSFEFPQKSGDELNSDPNLFALNSVRSTLHQAMVRKQNRASETGRRYLS